MTTGTLNKACPECNGVGFLPEYEADAGYKDGFHQVGESRCGTCGGDGEVPDEAALRDRLIEACFDELGNKWQIDPEWNGSDSGEDEDFWGDVIDVVLAEFARLEATP